MPAWSLGFSLGSWKGQVMVAELTSKAVRPPEPRRLQSCMETSGRNFREFPQFALPLSASSEGNPPSPAK